MSVPIKNIPLGEFDLSLSCIRLINNLRIRQVEKSMSVLGQFQPIVARICPEGCQIIGGLKRYYSGENLVLDSLQCRPLDIDLAMAKVLLLLYTRPHQSRDAWEEALVLNDLIRTHDLDQIFLSEVTGYSRSWVSPRLALIEKMDADLSQEIMLGTLTSSHTHEIIKLTGANQQKVTKVIISLSITSRQRGALVEAFIKTTGNTQRQYVLDHPIQAIEKRHDDHHEPYDLGLSRSGDELKISTRCMRKSLFILSSRMQDDRIGKLSETERMILLEDILPLSN